MQNLYETVKKAQMVVQVEAVKVQKDLAVYVYAPLYKILNYFFIIVISDGTIKKNVFSSF